jgi:hypothetical protein
MNNFPHLRRISQAKWMVVRELILLWTLKPFESLFEAMASEGDSLLKGNWQRLSVLMRASLKGLAVLGALAVMVGCGNPSPPPAAPRTQPTGAVIAVIEGTLIVSHSGQEIQVKAGDEVPLSTGYRAGSGPDAGVTLRLPDQSVLLLDPSATFQVVNWSQTEDISLRGLAGNMTLTAHSDRITLEMSSVTSFGLNSLNLKVTPASDSTIVSLRVDDPTVHLVVEQGEASLSINDTLYQVVAGTEVNASPGLDPDIIAATAPEAVTPSPVPTELPIPQTPTAGAVSLAETYPYPAPTLIEPEHQASVTRGSAISLKWEPVAEADSDAWYEVQLWQTTAAPYTVVGRVQSDTWSSESEFQPGTYRWRIQVVRLSDGAYLSPPSETREFTLSQNSHNPGSTPARPQTVQLPTPPSTSGQASPGFYPKPALLSPANETVFQAEDTIVLTWDSAGTLQDDQWYEVRLWENGTEWRGAVKTRSTSWQVPKDYNPGRYGWRVAAVLTQDGNWVKDISPQSDMRFFVWNSPPLQGDDHSSDSGGGPPSRR